MQEIILKKRAEVLRLERYFTGLPCKRGHVSERRTSDSMCIECLRVLSHRPESRQKANERASKWYAENKERASVNARRYRSTNKREISEKGLIYRARNKPRITEAQAKYRKEKKEELARKQRAAYAVLGSKRWLDVSVKAAITRARKAGVPFDEAAIRDYLSSPNTHCPVFGLKLEIGKGRLMSDTSPSLDRIVPEMGYVRGNMALISWRANRLKSDASADELRQIALWIDRVLPERKGRLAA